MDFGTFRTQKELKFNQNAVDVFLLADKSFLHEAINNFAMKQNEYDETEIALFERLSSEYDTIDIEELIQILKNLLQNNRHLFWDFKFLEGVYYIDMFGSDLDPFNGEWDDYKLIEFNLSSYKFPTFIIKKDN